MDVLLAPDSSGVQAGVLGSPTERASLSWDELAVRADGEWAEARWVWPDTASLYPPLLARGVRVPRCLDLRLTRTILDRIEPGDVVPVWLERREETEGTLLDLPRVEATLDDLAAEVADQARRIAQVRDPERLRLLCAAESAGALIAAEMRADGMPWSRARHDEILADRLGPRPPAGFRPREMDRLATEIADLLQAPRLNLDSPVALLKALRRAGLSVESTSKWELRRLDHPVVEPLLAYKSLARLLAANGWAWLDAWVAPGREDRADRFRTDYVPGGVVTGRWATSGGGALQIPKSVRGAVVADPGWRLVVADAAQIEPRVLAAMARDVALATAGRGDLYQGLVDSGVVDTRDHAKIGMLSALYGGTSGEAGLLLPRLKRAYPKAVGYVDRAAADGERGQVVRTWLGRTSPPPGSAWREVQDRAGQGDASDSDERRARSQARDWGRFTRNFVVQGTAAEWALCWMAGLRRRLEALAPVGGSTSLAPGRGRPHLVFFLHDEIVVHTPAEVAEHVRDLVVEAAESAGRLMFGTFPITFPLDVAIVETYDQAG
ncbi:bifunctional 3'-5' exonuclease/DNA polymerase [Nocardioides sp. GXZ039]|uniref:bifunctional 3'-5' exonuclease/DNA polymerase n=1 Tax=Nocardioides sp. GXZ039 TaxID=3136018 RepID=UPI0030F40811